MAVMRHVLRFPDSLHPALKNETTNQTLALCEMLFIVPVVSSLFTHLCPKFELFLMAVVSKLIDRCAPVLWIFLTAGHTYVMMTAFTL
jgi:hypothetical protein